MIALLLALAAAPGAPAEAGPQEGQATLQSCEMTPGGWICHYKMPPVTLVGTPDTTPPGTVAPPPITVTPPPPPMPAVAPVSEPDRAEAARQARLIARCADADWKSLCLPGQRREARALKEAALVKAALRSRVTGLLGGNKCAEAVKAALDGGDLDLAREARAFCRTN